MKMINENDVICAIITPVGRGALGAIRISGKGSKSVFEKIWFGQSVDKFEPRKIYLGKIVDNNNGQIDEVTTVIFEEGSSYTGEETVEIFCHGADVILKKIIRLIVESGARIAEPGEFTRRAFLNGRIDLAQAESIADLISSQSDAGSRLAIRHLSGELSKKVGEIRASIIDVRSLSELNMDFSDEEAAGVGNDEISNKIEHIKNLLEKLLSTYTSGHLLIDGVQVGILGAPNVGKSSIFNALLKRERAIVHHEAGTTRDIITERIFIDGIPFHLHDSAGWRSSDDYVEAVGVERAKDLVRGLDLILLVFDLSRDFNDDDREILKHIDYKIPVIVVFNKSDLPLLSNLGGIELGSSVHKIKISAKSGIGIDELKGLLSGISIKKVSPEGVVISNERHKKAIEDTLIELNSAKNELEENADFTIISHHLRLAQDKLSEITGEIFDDDILNRIFSKFCIGK